MKSLRSTQGDRDNTRVSRAWSFEWLESGMTVDWWSSFSCVLGSAEDIDAFKWRSGVLTSINGKPCPLFMLLFLAAVVLLKLCPHPIRIWHSFCVHAFLSLLTCDMAAFASVWMKTHVLFQVEGRLIRLTFRPTYSSLSLQNKEQRPITFLLEKNTIHCPLTAVSGDVLMVVVVVVSSVSIFLDKEIIKMIPVQWDQVDG